MRGERDELTPPSLIHRFASSSSYFPPCLPVADAPRRAHDAGLHLQLGGEPEVGARHAVAGQGGVQCGTRAAVDTQGWRRSRGHLPGHGKPHVRSPLTIPRQFSLQLASPVPTATALRRHKGRRVMCLRRLRRRAMPQIRARVRCWTYGAHGPGTTLFAGRGSDAS